ncbi:MAG TPA: tRNA (N(6)-L-threonylcarbamoyladenosine(37)-C(2))-methylthiotransferase MtaB [Bacteroidales bacterium]|jgi:threonylcarbamoyladenosine tRNA methylthiotransferase MtaB|nr:tRNA (N(6)-L-threonylcarbamoyladenosine(37)-C(2))-methylthiotransferase MtaB [Bacteroidales bacterium]
MEITKRKVAFHTLGCKLNFAETSTIARSFPEDQYVRVPAGSKADIYVINTCSVTDTADRKCRQAIKKFIHQAPEAVIAVVGCYAQLNPDEIASIPGVDLVLGTSEKFDVAKYLKNFTKKDAPEIYSCGLKMPDAFFPSFSAGDRTRSFLKVQDGCDYKCSYCTIPAARGKSRNQDIKSILEEAGKIARQGIKEIVITGVNIGDFGKTTGDSFAALMRELIKVDGIERYRISSIEPNLLTDELIDLAAGSPRILPHFHIPLQSGSDRILGLMRRRYTRSLFADRVNAVRKKMPLAGIGADVIVGFPGESDADFEDTFSFLGRTGLSYLHVFNFSERPGTPAASMKEKVPFRVREERSKRLIALSEKKHEEFCRMNTGLCSKVLFEHTKRDGMITGFTENYISAVMPWDPGLAGKIRTVRLTGIDPSGRMTATLTE